jgi:hypothetical protein
MDETEYVVQGLYTEFIGWEDLTFCETRAEAREECHTYNVNEPDVPHRVVTRRDFEGELR